MPETIPKPRTTVTVAGQKLGLQFDLNTNQTKRGVKMQFILDSDNMDPKAKQELTQLFLVNRLHYPVGLHERDDDFLIVQDVVIIQRPVFAVFEPFLRRLIAADYG